MELGSHSCHQHPGGVAIRRLHPVRRAQDLFAGLVLPELLPADGVQRIEESVLGADEQPVAKHEWGGLDGALGLELPEPPAVREVQCVEVAVVRTDIHTSTRDGGGGFHRAGGLERPEQLRLGRQAPRGLTEECGTAAEHRPRLRAGCDGIASARAERCPAPQEKRQRQEQPGNHADFRMGLRHACAPGSLRFLPACDRC